MTNEELQAYLTGKFSKAEVSLGKQYVEMIVKSEDLVDTAAKLKGMPELSLDYLFCLTGVDYPEKMQIVYHLESTIHRHVLVMKCDTADRVDPKIDSIREVWQTGKYHEREVYDLMGVHFNNHNDLRRLFLEDGWGFPLRKDYKDEVRIVER